MKLNELNVQHNQLMLMGNVETDLNVSGFRSITVNQKA